jgi:hypothetical protein
MEVGEHKIFFSLMEAITMMTTRKNTPLDRTAELLLRISVKRWKGR